MKRYNTLKEKESCTCGNSIFRYVKDNSKLIVPVNQDETMVQCAKCLKVYKLDDCVFLL